MPSCREAASRRPRLSCLVAEILRRRRPELSGRYVVPVSSGLIAGESLMGVLVAVLIVLGVLAK